MTRKTFILSSDQGIVGVARININGNTASLSTEPLKLCTFGTPYLLCENEYVSHKTKAGRKYIFDLPENTELSGMLLKKGEEILAWSGKNKPETMDSNEKSVEVPDTLTFDNFFGGGFVWQRIRGNFITHNYSIIHHILSGQNVYSSINRSGYYCIGTKETNDMKILCIAIPKSKNDTSPFDGLNTKTYIISSGNRDFYAVCAGVDKSGEFFLTY